MAAEGDGARAILALLALDSVAIVDDLKRIVDARFRAPQQLQLLAVLRSLRAEDRDRLVDHFDRKLDVRDELDRYLQDVLKLLHFVSSAGKKTDARSDPRVALLAGVADRGDREVLARAFQALGTAPSVAFCRVVVPLSPRGLHDVLVHFTETLSELKEWMQWVEASAEPDVATEFLTRLVREQCLAVWLVLLKPLNANDRFRVVSTVRPFPLTASSVRSLSKSALSAASPLRQLGRFLETTSVSPARLLEFSPVTVKRDLPVLLEVFPTVSLQLVLAKFGTNAELMETIAQRGLALLGANELLELLDGLLGPVPDAAGVERFLSALFAFERLHAFLALFFRLDAANRLRLAQLTVLVTSSSTEQATPSRAVLLFALLLDANISDHNLVLSNLVVLPIELVVRILDASRSFATPADVVAIGECLETATDPAALSVALPLFLRLDADARQLLVAWLRDVSDASAVPVYRVLKRQLASDQASSSHKAFDTLKMLVALPVHDKQLLASEVLISDDDHASPDLHEQLIAFLCGCEDSARHKTLRLLCAVPSSERTAFVALLRSQPMPEQEALVRLMRRIPHDATKRLLNKVATLSSDAIDALFALLLLIPSTEGGAIGKLLTSPKVAPSELEALVMVAVDMKNQAASRELAMFAADLSGQTRTCFFAMLQGDRVEKGVLLRIIGLSTRIAPPLLHQIVPLLGRLMWAERSTLVEQLRALDAERDVQALADVLSELDDEALRWPIALLNPFGTLTRVELCDLLLRLPGASDRRAALAMLIGVPKNKIGGLVISICERECAPISATFLRVLAHLDSEYQLPLVPLLEHETWWYLISLMDSAIDKSHHDGELHHQDLVNAVASVLVLLIDKAEHLLQFSAVVRGALAKAVPLAVVLTVATSLLPDLDKLLGLLRYAQSLDASPFRDIGTPLFFRVLAQSSHPELLLELCRVADQDDAVFALRRLDRMLGHDDHRPQALAMLERLSQRLGSGVANVVVKDALFNFVRRFRELSPREPDSLPSTEDRVITPRSGPFESAPDRTIPGLRGIEDWRVEEAPGRLIPQTSPPSHRRVALNRHVRNTRPETEGFPRQRSTRKSWWQDAELTDTSIVQGFVDDDSQRIHDSDKDIDVDTSPRVEPCSELDQQDPVAPDTTSTESPNNEAEPPLQLPPIASHQQLPRMPTANQTICDDDKALRARSKSKASNHRHEQPLDPIDTLPPTRPDPPTDPILSQVGHADPRPEPIVSQEHCASVSLARSESAPATLDTQWRWSSERQKKKHLRGLTGGLALPPTFHAPLDRGAKLLHRQCNDAITHSPARIHFSKTPAGQAQVMKVRLDRALGHRKLAAVASQPSLLRSNRHTVELATEAMALSREFRALEPRVSLASGSVLHGRTRRDGDRDA